MADLVAPLIAGRPIETAIDLDFDLKVAGNGDDNVSTDSDLTGDGDGSADIGENSYDFIGAAPLGSYPAMVPVDPFRNHTPTGAGSGGGVGLGFYEWLKIVVCLPIALVRLVLFGLALGVGYLATVVALHGWKDKQSPMPRWRRRIMWITRVCARVILFAFGYHWIKRRGRPASRDIAPIVVSNHISYVEPIYFFFELFPTMVASESHDALPFVGTIIRAMQVIYVDRSSAESRKQAIYGIKARASSNSFPRVMLFPEGTTSNGRFLLSFQLGAFIPGFPIQPVVVRYPYVHFDQSWGTISLLQLMFRMFTQFHNFMEVEYLPVVLPSKLKQHDAIHFAERTRYVMASALNVLPTAYSYGDLLLVSRALEQGKENCSNYMAEMAWIARIFDISTLEAETFLDRFLVMNPDSSGHVQIHGFLIALGLGICPLGSKIFGYLDYEGKGYITFREFLMGSAHVRKQPSFLRACEAAFQCCCYDDSTGYITFTKVDEIIQSVPGIICDSARVCQLFDVDNDGAVSRNDFMECLHRNPLLIALFASHAKDR